MSALTLPATLSPSKISEFKDCALAFKFSAIDRIPSEPTVDQVRGTLVHRALEMLYTDVPKDYRSHPAAVDCLDKAWTEIQSDPEYLSLTLAPGTERDVVYFEAAELLVRYFALEDPRTVNAIGFERMVSIEMAGTTVRGIIDRLDREPDGLVVVDYKTGSVPREQHEAGRFAGLHLYAALVEQVLGERPKAVRLMYLKQPVVIEAPITEQSVRGVLKRAEAVWAAIVRACERDDFRPKPGPLCDWCSYRDRCPAWSGSPVPGRAPQ